MGPEWRIADFWAATGWNCSSMENITCYFVSKSQCNPRHPVCVSPPLWEHAKYTMFKRNCNPRYSRHPCKISVATAISSIEKQRKRLKNKGQMLLWRSAHSFEEHRDTLIFCWSKCRRRWKGRCMDALDSQQNWQPSTSTGQTWQSCGVGGEDSGKCEQWGIYLHEAAGDQPSEWNL